MILRNSSTATQKPTLAALRGENAMEFGAQAGISSAFFFKQLALERLGTITVDNNGFDNENRYPAPGSVLFPVFGHWIAKSSRLHR